MFLLWLESLADWDIWSFLVFQNICIET